MIYDPQPEGAPDILEADRKGKILIVDDDVDLAFVLSRRLEKIGFAIATEHEGAAGLRRAEAEPPNLVVLDLQLPDISGLEVCRELVDNPHTCGVPVIILSGSDDNDVVRECRAAGSEFFVRKPYDPNVLLALIEQSLSSW